MVDYILGRSCFHSPGYLPCCCRLLSLSCHHQSRIRTQNIYQLPSCHHLQPQQVAKHWCNLVCPNPSLSGFTAKTSSTHLWSNKTITAVTWDSSRRSSTTRAVSTRCAELSRGDKCLTQMIQSSWQRLPRPAQPVPQTGSRSVDLFLIHLVSFYFLCIQLDFI